MQTESICEVGDFESLLAGIIHNRLFVPFEVEKTRKIGVRNQGVIFPEVIYNVTTVPLIARKRREGYEVVSSWFDWLDRLNRS